MVTIMSEIDRIVALLEEAYRAPAWHGDNLREVLQTIPPEQALWQTGRGRPVVWALVLHCAYWKHTVINRLTGAETPFPHPGADWPVLPDPADEQAWARDLALLDQTHERLLEVVRGLDPARLDEPISGPSEGTAIHQLRGVAMHDTYHAGQIRSVVKLGELSGFGEGVAA